MNVVFIMIINGDGSMVIKILHVCSIPQLCSSSQLLKHWRMSICFLLVWFYSEELF